MNGKATILPLELDNVSYAAGGKRLIKDLTCTFGPGPKTVIIGPNGAGKSLLLRLCHGLLTPSQGSVRWHGEDGPGGQHPARRQAMVFQRPVMLRRSALANVEYALALQGVGGGERRTRAMAALDFTGLARHALEPARVLSVGEQQRLALARAWSIRPEVLFLDEPTASLDPAAAAQVESIIQAIHAAGTRIVLTTHDLGQAKRLADEVMFLYRGRIKEHRAAADFFAGPENDLAQAFVAGELVWWRRGDGACGQVSSEPPSVNPASRSAR